MSSTIPTTRGGSGLPSTSGANQSPSSRRDGRPGSTRGSPSVRGGNASGTPTLTSNETPADTLDKLLNELVNASAARVTKVGVGGRGGSSSSRESHHPNGKTKSNNLPDSPWDLKRIGLKLYKGGGGGSRDSAAQLLDSSDFSGDFTNNGDSLSSGGNTSLLTSSKFGRELRVDFDDATRLIYGKASRDLSKIESGYGLYRDSGLGVGGIGGGIGGASQNNNKSDGTNSDTNTTNASGKAFGLGEEDGRAGDRSGDTTGISNSENDENNPNQLYTSAGGLIGVSLREHVEAEARDKPTEVFQKYKKDLFERIKKLIQSADVSKRLAGVYAIDQLLDSKIGETSNKMNRFSLYLRDVLTVNVEPVLAEAVAAAVGKVARVGGALTAGIADRDVKRSIEWLRAGSVDGHSTASDSSPAARQTTSSSYNRRYAAVLVLRELAMHAPTVFNVHVSSFIDAVWPALRDVRLYVREAAVRALRACLVVIERRETRYRVQWYYRLYEETQNGLSVGDDQYNVSNQSGTPKRDSPHNITSSALRVSSQHGSLLAFGELLRHTGEFMLSRYKEVAETVLGLQSSDEIIVRRAVMNLVPKLAAFSPKRFTESYLEISMRVLLLSLKTPEERDAGFTAIGDVAAALHLADLKGVSGKLKGNRSGSFTNLPGSPRASNDRNQSGDSPRSPSTHGENAFERSLAESSNSNLKPKHTRTPSGGVSGFVASLARITSQGSLSGMGNYPGSSGDLHHLIVKKDDPPLTKYLPEIARATRELCASIEKNQRELNLRVSTKSGLRPAPTHKERGAAECFLCVGALAKSIGSAWEPFVVDLLPCMFAGGLSYELVAALAAIVVALPDTKRGVEKRVVDAISNVLTVTTEDGGGNITTPGSQRKGTYPPVERAELQPDRFEEDGWDGQIDGLGGLNGAHGGIDGGALRNNNMSNGMKSSSSSSNLKSTLKRVFSSGLFRDTSRHVGSPPVTPRGSTAHGLGNTSVHGSTDSFQTGSPGTPGHTPHQPSPLGVPKGMLPKTPKHTPGSPKKTGKTSKASKAQVDLLDKAAQKFHRNRVQLALRTLGTFPFTTETGTVSLGYARKRVVFFLDDDDPATRREAALTCCRLLDVKNNGGMGSGDGDAIGIQSPQPSSLDSPRRESSLANAGSSGSITQKGWSVATEEILVQNLLQVAVSDLDCGVRTAVLASFCKPSPVVDGYLGQAESLRLLFVALNDENFTVKLIAIRLVGRLAPRNPAYALPALRRHLLQLIAELERSAESHLREESARLLATLVRSCPRLVSPYIAPILRTLTGKLRDSSGGGGGKGSGSSGTVDPENRSMKPSGDGQNDISVPINTDETQPRGDVDPMTGLQTGHGVPTQNGGNGLKGPDGQPDPVNGFSDGQVNNVERSSDTSRGSGPDGSTNQLQTSKTTSSYKKVSIPVKEKAAVLGAIGEIALVGAGGMIEYSSELLPLIIDGLRGGATRDVAVVTLGQLIEATGLAITPFAEHPHLLRLLLRVLAEESSDRLLSHEVRSQTLRTLGILGALDPLAHKDNEERLHGQGLLSMEGVRGVGRDKSGTNAGDDDAPNTTKGNQRDVQKDRADLSTQNIDDKKKVGGNTGGNGAKDETLGDDEGVTDKDPIPFRHLTTASDAFYPTVALNALLRVLRDPKLSSRHYAVTRSIMYIFRALGRDCVPYLPATVPVVLRVIHRCDDSGREFMYAQLVLLVQVVNGHVRRYLDDILSVVRFFWGPGPLLKQSLRLLEALSEALHDDFRKYLPEVLPKVVGVLADAERSGEYTAVPATLRALESFGSAADEHLHLALPTLVRLFRPQVAASVPTPVRAAVLKSLAQLLPRAQLAGHASAVAHPLIRVLDGEVDELRPYALAALTAMAHSLRDDFSLFTPMINRVMEKRGLRDLLFERAVALASGNNQYSAHRDEPPLANAVGGGGNMQGTTTPLPDPNQITSGFANLALRAQKEVQDAYELNESHRGGDRSKTPTSMAFTAGDSLYRGGSNHPRGDGSVYGGRSPDLDNALAFSPLGTGYGAHGVPKDFSVDEVSLRRAWDSSSRSTKEDWLEWMRHLSVEMLKQSPSPALRACLELASTRPRTASDLFCASFASCWSGLSERGRESIVSALEAAFGAPTIPPEIVAVLLNLAEFCEHDERPLPVEARTLGAIAERCRAYAKALHYKETEFVSNPSGCVEAIIAINNRLQLPEAAMGVLVYAQAHLRLEIKEGWYEKLGQWENALDAHRRKAAKAESAMRDADLDLNQSLSQNAPGSPSARKRERRLSRSSATDTDTDDTSKNAYDKGTTGDAANNSQSNASTEIAQNSKIRGSSIGKRRDLFSGSSMGGSTKLALSNLTPMDRERERQLHETSVARKRANQRQKEIARETQREATLGQMRCLAALAEWEALGRLCAREWDLSSSRLTASSSVGALNMSDPIDSKNDSNAPSRKDQLLRQRMAPLATQAAWHLGDWRAMDTYCSAMKLSTIVGDSKTGNTVNDSDPNTTSLIGAGLGDRSGLIGDDEFDVSDSTSIDPSSYAEGDDVKPVDVEFFKAVLATRRGDVEEARVRIASARHFLAPELAALVTESYDRSYGGMVRVQQLTELEEVIEYAELGRVAQAAEVGGMSGGIKMNGLTAPSGAFGALANVNDARSALTRRELMRNMWRERIYGVQRKVEVWQALLSVRSLVLPAREETGTWLKFASLNRKAGRTRQAHRTLLRLLEYDPSRCKPGSPGYGAGSGQPDVMLAYVKHQWALGNKRDAFARLQSLVGELRATSAAAVLGTSPTPPPKLVARAFLRLGQWRWALAEDMDDSTLTDVLTAFRAATDSCTRWAKAWHHWALFNAAAMEHYQRILPAAANRHVAPAISGFFRSIALGGSDLRKGKSGSLQDILRLLTLWFNHGAAPEVEAALVEGFGHVSIDTWLAVIPQIVARIHSNSTPVRSLIHQLLVRVGRQHPQALLYPLLVACKSQSASRRGAATAVLENLRRHSALLVEQAQVVSLELIRVAILWHEAWHEALEEASQLYFGEQNVDGMLRVLAPLHHIVERLGAETLHEISFTQAYGRELSEANEWCRKYRETGLEEELNQAWDLYYHVFKRINKQLPTLTTLELKYVSPRLLSARQLELCVPGNYAPGVPGGYGGSATIAGFAPVMHVITSKQRPRRLHIHGSDGKDYGYLLKGHEDLRQDERVMQLFGLVNSLLAATPSTSARDLSIARYAVVPLSPNSGLIGWVPNCDTLHALIREHRDAHKVPLNLEQRLMLAMAPDYDHLPLVNKVEVFEHALENTPGNDLARVMWLKSRSSEVWLDRRTTYTRSLATMSMVGYLLGLGDRHPSNLMLDRYSGKLLHIDFGDCFEASMFREKFPERVPFRLTRMLVRAMEVSGIEGNFRSTCEGVMNVLRGNKDSVMAMLEAFVHDPLINWRLLNTTAPGENANEYTGAGVMAVSAVHTSSNAPTPVATPGPGDSNSNSNPNSNANSTDQSPRVTPPTSPFEGAEGGVEKSGTPNLNIVPEEAKVEDTSGGPGVGVDVDSQASATHTSGDESGDQLDRSKTPPPWQNSDGAVEMSPGRITNETPGTPSHQNEPQATPEASVNPETVYAAASELQRGRVTALDAVEGLNVDANEVLNDRAVSVMKRMSHKLTGRDGAPGSASSAASSAVSNRGAPISPGQKSTFEDIENSVPDGIEAQVQRLILAATSHENLCESYIGYEFWMPSPSATGALTRPPSATTA